MSRIDLLVWAKNYLIAMKEEHDIVAFRAEKLDSFLLARRAHGLEGTMFRLRWCIERAEKTGEYDCLWTEWERCNGIPASDRVGSCDGDRGEARGSPAASGSLASVQ